MEAIKAALILMKNSHFDRTPQYVEKSQKNTLVAIPDVHERIELFGFFWAQHVGLDSESLAKSVKPLVLIQPFLKD